MFCSCEVWSERFVVPPARRCSPCHCLILWAVSTFTAKTFIAASCRGVVLWVVRHRKVFIDPRVSLTEFLSLSHPSRVLMTFSLSGHRHLLRLRVLILTLLSLALHAGCSSHAFEFCCTVFLLSEDFECLPSLFLSAVKSLSAGCGPYWRISVFADLALYLAVRGPASVELSCSLSLSLSPQAHLQHHTWQLHCCLLEVWVSTCSGPCCESSSVSVSITPQITCFRGAKVCSKWLQEKVTN